MANWLGLGDVAIEERGDLSENCALAFERFDQQFP